MGLRHVFEKDIARDSQVSGARRRIFIACEDYKTEVSYFNRLLEESERLGLYGRVEVILLNRYYPDRGVSDPMRVARMCHDHMLYLERGVCTKDMFAGVVLEEVGEENRVMVSDMLADEGFACMVGDDGIISDIQAAQEFAVGYMSDRGFEITVILPRKEYYPDTDEVYLVVDRDDRSERPPDKYLAFISYCREKGFVPVVTNPQFEFWMLMHIEDVGGDLEAVRDSKNPAATLKRRMKARGMEKGHPNLDALIPGLDVAMRRSERYLLSAEELVSRVGTRMPVLINALKDDEGR